jgi:hypothetical protein
VIVNASSRVLRNLAVLLVVVGGLAACSSDVTESLGTSPLAPETTAADGDGRVSAQSRPNAVFITVPAADPDDAIRGNNPLRVQFNNCQSRPGDEDDNLKFTYDFDNDGTVDAVDAFGHCRSEQTFTGPATARVCVSDRRGNDVCRTWDIRPSMITTAERPRVTSITFIVDFIPDGGLAFPFELYLNGTLMGTMSTSGTPFACPAMPITFTATNPAWIDGQSNMLRFLKTGPRAVCGWRSAPASTWAPKKAASSSKPTSPLRQGRVLPRTESRGRRLRPHPARHEPGRGPVHLRSQHAVTDVLAGDLGEAHAVGLIHRDFTPANIRLAGRHAARGSERFKPLVRNRTLGPLGTHRLTQ